MLHGDKQGRKWSPQEQREENKAMDSRVFYTRHEMNRDLEKKMAVNLKR